MPARSRLAPRRTARRLVAAARAAGTDIRLRRNGSRGMYWLEPLVEIECGAGRIGYGPVNEHDVDGLVAAGMLRGEPHALCIGPVDGHPWLASQQRLTFARVGRTEPLDLGEYVANGGYRGLAPGARDRPGRDRHDGRGFRAARPGRRRVPGWREVADGSRPARRREIRRLQCRRGRLGHLLRPHAHGRRPLLAHRGHDHRRCRGRRDAGLHLPARRVPARPRDPARSDRCAPGPRATSVAT